VHMDTHKQSSSQWQMIIMTLVNPCCCLQCKQADDKRRWEGRYPKSCSKSL